MYLTASSLAAAAQAGRYRPLSLNRVVALVARAKEMLDAAGEHLTIRISGWDRSAIVGRHKMDIRRLDALGSAGRFTLHEETRERGTGDMLSVNYIFFDAMTLFAGQATR